MDKVKLVQITDYRLGVEGSVIRVIEQDADVTFPIKRVYWICSGNGASQHGNHAHINPEQLLVCINGSARVDVTEINGHQEKFELCSADQALYIPPSHWLVVHLKPQSTLLCLSSMLFSEQETVFDLKEFLSTK